MRNEVEHSQLNVRRNNVHREIKQEPYLREEEETMSLRGEFLNLEHC
jgi:hypothetical protein